METIVIEGKDYRCSKIVKQEIEWQDIRIATARNLAKMIEDEQDEFETQYHLHQSKMNILLQQLKEI